MLAGTLGDAGYYMGGTMLPPTPSNPKGYFESAEINELNNELIASVATVRPSGPLGYFYPWRLSRGLLWLADIDVELSLQPTAKQATQIREFVSQKPFCFKDPRFCYTLGAWRPVLDDTAFLCIFREPGRTLSSIKKDVRERYLRERYSGFYLTQHRALRAWTSMYKHVLEKHSKEGPWLFVHYDQILDGSAIPRIEDAIGVKVNADFVDPNLKRSQASGKLPEQTLQVYEHLCTRAEYA
jgi:hypothetical protein